MLSCVLVAGLLFIKDVGSDQARAGERLVPFDGTTFQRADRVADGYRGQNERLGNFLIVTPANGPDFVVDLGKSEDGMTASEILAECYRHAERP